MVNGESTPAIGNKVRNLRPRGIVKRQTANVKGSINFEPRALSVILKRQSAIRSEPLGLTNRKTGNSSLHTLYRSINIQLLVSQPHREQPC
jgi:hypothetical protein